MHLLLCEDTEDPQDTARAVHLHVLLLVCLLDRYKYLFKYGRLCQWKADLNLIQWTQTKTKPQHRQCRVQLYIEEVPRFHNIRNQSKQWRYRLGGYDLSFIYDNTSMSNNLQVNCKGSTFYCVFFIMVSQISFLMSIPFGVIALPNATSISVRPSKVCMWSADLWANLFNLTLFLSQRYV